MADLISELVAIAERFPPSTEYTIEHDGFRGRVIGYYLTEEGKPGVVLQLANARVVHVYGTKWLEPKATAPATNETAKSYSAEEPELKGGDLARRAAMRCGEQPFQRFIGAEDKDTAKAIILHRCGVSSRKMLDHDSKAAVAWRQIEDKFSLWKGGFDVEF